MFQQELSSEFQGTGFSELLEEDPCVSWELPVSWGGDGVAGGCAAEPVGWRASVSQ